MATTSTNAARATSASCPRRSWGRWIVAYEGLQRRVAALEALLIEERTNHLVSLNDRYDYHEAMSEAYRQLIAEKKLDD